MEAKRSGKASKHITEARAAAQRAKLDNQAQDRLSATAETTETTKTRKTRGKKEQRDPLARRNHHGLVVGLILRRDHLVLIAGDAGLRRRHVAAVAAGESGGRSGSKREKRRCGKRGKNA